MVSIDTEFSGLGDGKLTRQTNIQDRYSALKTVAEEHSLLALGFSIFINDGSQVKAHNFHFLMFCREDWKISSASIAFLAKNNFDFNHLFKYGISLDRSNRNPSLLKIWLELQKVRVVVHNGWLDLMYLYSCIYADLPTDLGSFMADLYDMFSLGIYDTKYIADFEFREKASFLAYLYGKWERLGSDGLLIIKEESIPMPKSEKTPVKSVKPIDKKGNSKPYCERYAGHGYCPLSDQCPKSHDLDIILEHLENLPRLAKKPRIDSTLVEKQEEKSLIQSEHSACFDSYMTGFVFTHQINANQDLLANAKNKLYLIGKSRPLLIEKSRYAQYSKGHLKYKN